MQRLSAAVMWTAVLLDRWHWLALAAAAPALLFPAPARLPFLLVVPALWGAAWLARREALPVTPFNGALLAFYLMVLVSLWATYDLQVSLSKVAGLVLAAGVFFAVARIGRAARPWTVALVFFLSLGGGLAGIALLGTQWFTKIAFLAPVIERLPPPLIHLPGAEDGFQPNGVAGALLWVLPALLILTPWLWLRRRWLGERLPAGWARAVLALLAGLTALVLVVFVLTQSRGGYLALALTGLAAGLLVLVWQGRWRWALGVGLLAGAAGAVVWALGGAAAVGALPGVGAGAASLDTLDGRLELWSRALYAIQDFAFTGLGLNTFRTVVHVLYPLFLIAPDFDVAHAHNEFLQAALDLGLPGLIAFLALNGLAFVQAAVIARRAPAEWQRVMALALGAGVLAHMLFGLTDAVALGAKVGIVFWILLGLIAGLFQQVTGAPPGERPAHG